MGRTLRVVTPDSDQQLRDAYGEVRCIQPIALVNVPYGRSSGRSMRPLGLAALGSFLKQQGVDTFGYDLSDTSLTPQQLVSKYHLSEFPVVGLSFYNVNATCAYELARTIKERNESVIVIAGGPHASATARQMLERNPQIDIAVRNEGEYTMSELLAALAAGNSLTAVPGIAFRHLADVVVTPERSPIADLDTLPAPAFRFASDLDEEPSYYFDIDARRTRRAVSLVTSRSCPYNCSFCAIILIGRKWRSRSEVKVLEDLVALERHNNVTYEHVYFLDANFFVDSSRALAIAAQLHGLRSDITFSFSTRVNQLIRGARHLAELRHYGLRAVELGIESGSAAALTRFAKDTAPAQNDQALGLLREHRIQLLLDFIMFDAEASVDDLLENLSFLERHGLDSYVPWDHIFSHMTPYVGTPIRSRYEALHRTSFDDDVLPDPATLILDETVRAVFQEIWRLQPMLRRLESALTVLEDKVERLPWSRERARISLNAATLRRLPFVTLRNLVLQAHRCNRISLTTALPTLVDDAGAERQLDELLAYALH